MHSPGICVPWVTSVALVISSGTSPQAAAHTARDSWVKDSSYISYLMVAVIKYQDQKQLSGGGTAAGAGR